MNPKIRLLPRNQEGFNEALNLIKQSLFGNAHFDKKREEYMQRALHEREEELLSEHPEFRDKEKIRALIFLGSFHTGFSHELKSVKGRAATRKFSERDIIYDFSNELMRRVMFGKEVSDELVARSLLENLLRVPLHKETEKLDLTANEFSTLMRKIVSQFTPDEIREFYFRLPQDVTEKESYRGEFLRTFFVKGITIPTQREDL